MGTLLRTLIRGAGYSVIRRIGLPKTIAVGVVALVSLWVLTGDAMAEVVTPAGCNGSVSANAILGCNVAIPEGVDRVTTGVKLAGTTTNGHLVVRTYPCLSDGTTCDTTLATGMAPIVAAGSSSLLNSSNVVSGSVLNFSAWNVGGLPYVRFIVYNTDAGAAHTATYEIYWKREAASLAATETKLDTLSTKLAGGLPAALTSGKLDVNLGAGGGGSAVCGDGDTLPDCQVAVSAPIELSEGDRNRSDLIWWGSWATVGLLLTLLIAPRFMNLLDPTRGL